MPSKPTLAPLWVSLFLLVCLLGLGGYAYAQGQHFPAVATRALLPALLLEAFLFLAHGLEEVRDRIKTFPPSTIPAGLFASALLPYLIYAIGSGTFAWSSLAWLVVIALPCSYYYVVLRHSDLADALLAAVLMIVILSDRFSLIYLPAAPKLPEKILGDLMLARTTGISLLCIRQLPCAYGFIPTWKEFRVGVREFLFFFPVACVLVYLTKFATIRTLGPPAETLLKVLATGAGIHLLVSLREELLVRGLLQPVMQRTLGSPVMGMAVTSVIFGLLHLGFVRKWPHWDNWKMALLATAAGWFYGRAFASGYSVRAVMVTHTLTVVCWRVFLV